MSPLTVGASWLGYEREGVDPLDLAKAMLAAPFAVVDTSNNYAGGKSETFLGQALAARGGLLPDHALVTKTDADADGVFDRDRAWRSYEESVSRLGIERFPLLHLHDPHSITFEEATAAGGALQGMIELREQGLAGAIGIAVGDLELQTKYVRTGAFDALLTHNQYTLVSRSAEPLIAEANEQNMGVFNAAIFGGGILAGTGSSYAYREASAELHNWLERLRALCAEWDLPTAAVALHFSLKHPGIHSTVVGMGRPERISELIELYQTSVPDDFWPALDELGTPSTIHA